MQTANIIGADKLPKQIPVLYSAESKDSANGNYYQETQNQICWSIDLFGCSFFCLTRYEELARPSYDSRDRFPASASLAYREGFLNRPIVNEYVELLWLSFKRLWPVLVRPQRSYRLFVSHDVDHLLYHSGRSFSRTLSSAANDAISRRDIELAWRRLKAFRQVKQGRIETDPYNTFDFIMSVSERQGLQSAFYFITDHSSKNAENNDGSYVFDDSRTRNLIRSIVERGHEIGLHPSYNTYLSQTQTQLEFDKLRQIAEEEGAQQTQWGGRQHFLRWQNPTTWQQNWEEAGLNYDSTLSFADDCGFRCGTCYEYPVFNLKTRQPLQLKERPLIAMEVTLLSYLGLSWQECFEKIKDLNIKCRFYNGDFTLLWHNNNLASVHAKRWYEAILRDVSP